VAMDVNGDGRVEFVVGGYDGWLYALDAATGALVWSLDLGAPVGDPIAADTDGDGLSEILAPTADGYLYAIGPAK
jgi:outer membrane protein assembly factor BamB